MIYGISLIILGILAAPSLLLSKKPDAKELLDKITPYQGWIGLVFCFWGIWGVIQTIIGIQLLSIFPILWILLITCTTVMTLLGFILGYGMINKLLLSKNEEAKEKGAAILAKLAPIQGKIGLAGIILGIIVVILDIIY